MKKSEIKKYPNYHLAPLIPCHPPCVGCQKTESPLVENLNAYKRNVVRRASCC